MDIETFLDRMFQYGALEVRLPGGRTLSAGDGSGPPVAVTIADNLTLAKIIAKPSLGVGEAYMDGRLLMEAGTIRDLLDLGSRNAEQSTPGGCPGPLGRWWREVRQDRNTRAAARRFHESYPVVAFYQLEFRQRRLREQFDQGFDSF